MPQGVFPYSTCFSVANGAVNWGCTVDGEIVDNIYLAVDPQCPILFTLCGCVSHRLAWRWRPCGWYVRNTHTTPQMLDVHKYVHKYIT